LLSDARANALSGHVLQASLTFLCAFCAGDQASTVAVLEDAAPFVAAAFAWLDE